MSADKDEGGGNVVSLSGYAQQKACAAVAKNRGPERTVTASVLEWHGLFGFAMEGIKKAHEDVGSGPYGQDVVDTAMEVLEPLLLKLEAVVRDEELP